MSNARQLLLLAETAAFTVEKAKANLEAARSAVEIARQQLEAAKGGLDEAYINLEAAGIPKAKARKAIEEIIGALAGLGIDDGEAVVAPAAATVVEGRQPAPRGRRKKDEAAEAGHPASGDNETVNPAISPAAETVEKESQAPVPKIGGEADEATTSAESVVSPAATEAEPVETAEAVGANVETDAEAGATVEHDEVEEPEDIEEEDASFVEDQVEDEAFGEAEEIEGVAVETAAEIPGHVDLFAAPTESAEAAPASAPAPAVEAKDPPVFRRPAFFGNKPRS